ncbi:MAG: head decoration protein [Rhodospirillales bacterium]|nr:head decoration protein [Rhodospirillales bacterium]
MADTSTMPWFSSVAAATIGAVLAYEQDHGRSRDAVTVLAGDGAARVLALGAVLGRRLIGAPTITPDEGNTGDGALGTLTLAAGVKVGTYKAVCIAAAENGGTFAVFDPDGFRLADVAVGVAYDGGPLAFTIADGDADFIVGDAIEVEVAAGDRKVVALAPAAIDGTQIAAGVLLAGVTAPDGADAAGQAATRECDLITSGLVWPAGITADQKTAALADMAKAGIRVLAAA